MVLCYYNLRSEKRSRGNWRLSSTFFFLQLWMQRKPLTLMRNNSLNAHIFILKPALDNLWTVNSPQLVLRYMWTVGMNPYDLAAFSLGLKTVWDRIHIPLLNLWCTIILTCAMKTTCFPLNFFSSSLTRRT